MMETTVEQLRLEPADHTKALSPWHFSPHIFANSRECIKFCESSFMESLQNKKCQILKDLLDGEHLDNASVFGA